MEREKRALSRVNAEEAEAHSAGVRGQLLLLLLLPALVEDEDDATDEDSAAAAVCFFPFAVGAFRPGAAAGAEAAEAASRASAGSFGHRSNAARSSAHTGISSE